MDTSDSEGMSVVADSESDTDDNLYTNRLMCADSFSLTPSLKVSFWAIECSPEIETLAHRRLTEVDKTALISGKINSLGSTSVSSGSSEEVLACDEEGCLNLQQEKGCTAVHCEGFNKHARNGIMGKTKSEQMYPLGEQEPVNPFVEFKVTQEAQSQTVGICDVVASAAMDQPQRSPPVSEPSSVMAQRSPPISEPSSVMAQRSPPVSDPSSVTAQRSPPVSEPSSVTARPGCAPPSYEGKLPSDPLTTPPARRVTLHSSQGKGGNGRERRAQVGVTCSASRPLEAEQSSGSESGPSFHSRSFSEKETLSSVPSARSSAILRGGEPAHKPQSVHTIQTRSACCVSQPVVAVDSTQQDRMACQSPPQPMGRRKIAQGRAHTRSETSASDCGRANLNGSGRSRMAGAESGQNTRRLRPLSGTPKINTKRKRKAPSEAEGSVCGSRDVNRGKGEYRTHSFAPQRSKTPRGKKKEALQRRGGKVVTLKTINRRNLRGETLLHRAAMDGDMQLITAILQLGVDVNRADYAGWTPLHEAVMGGWYETVAALLEAGAVVNCTGDKGVTPLHDAIDNGHHEIAQLLLDNGANPLLKNEQGRTALDMTDDDSLRKMIERYLHRTRTVSLSAQRTSNRFAIQEDGNRQRVVCTMQKKEEESAVDETDAEQQAGGEPSSQITSPSLCLRSRSVILPPVPGHPSTCPEGRSALPAEAHSQGCTEEVSLPLQDSINPSEDTFEVSSLDRATVCGTQEVAQMCGGKAMSTARVKSMMKKCKGSEPRRKWNDKSQTEGAGQSPVARRTMRRPGDRKRSDGDLNLFPLSGVLCKAGSGDISAERRAVHATEQDGESTARQPGPDNREPCKPVKPEDRKSAAARHCSQQDVHTDTGMNARDSPFSLAKIRSGFLDYDLGEKIPESNMIPCHVCKVFDETGEQCCVENTQEQQDHLNNSRSPDLAGSTGAQNKTGTKVPQTVGCETVLKDDTQNTLHMEGTVSQNTLPALLLENKPRSKGTTFDLIPGINGDPVINANTSDLLQNIHSIERDNRHENSGDSTEGSVGPVLPLKAPEVLRDCDLSANMSGESWIVRHSPGRYSVEEHSEECSISLLAPRSDVLRRMTVQQCLTSKDDRQENAQSDASKEEPTLTLESDSSTPSLLLESLNKREELSPSELRVASNVNENRDHGTSNKVSKVIDPESKTLSANVSMQLEAPDSNVKACSITCSVEEHQNNLHGLKSRTMTEPVQMTGTSSHVQYLSAVLHNSESEHQNKALQNHFVEKHLHTVEQISGLTETNDNTHFTLSCENSDRTRGRFLEEGCLLMTCSQADSPSTSGNSVQGREMEGKHVDKILKIACERPASLKCGEQLLKETLLYNLGSITFSCSETQVTSAIQEMDKTVVTECYVQETESRNGKERLVPKSNKINSLSTSNSKDVELAYSAEGSFDLNVNGATVREDIAQANSSYDSDCTMISESNYMEGNNFGSALENACLNPDLTLGPRKSQVKDNGKRSFEKAFGKSVENSTDNRKGNLTSSVELNSASAVDYAHKTSNVGNYVDAKHQNKDYVLSNFSGQESQKNKISKTKNTKSCKKEDLIQHKSKHNSSSTKHPARNKELCASACAAATTYTGSQQTLKLPIRDINKKNSRGESQLHLASKRGDLALVRALLGAGINVNQADYAGWTALHEASAQGYTAVVQELLLYGADVSSKGLEKVTPLHDAVASDHYETVKLLLQYGSDPNDQNIFGKSPLDMECHERIKELLSTFHGPYVSPREGSSKSSSAVVRGKPAAPCLCCESDCSGNGIQPTKGSHGSSKLESTITTLENMEKKQKEISTWELTGPEYIGKFTEAFSQIQDVLNNVLNIHKAENHELTQKYRMASDSFNQGILREQLGSLASRQKRLLSILQKQNVLKLGVQTQSCRLLARQTSTSCTPAGENQPEAPTPGGINTGPNRTTEQEAPLRCLDAVTEETPSSPSVLSPVIANVLHDSSDCTHITSDTESVEPEAEVDTVGDAEDAIPHKNIADNVLHLERGRPEAVLVQSKISGHQSLLSSSSLRAIGSRSDEQRSEVTEKKLVVGFLTVSNNTPSIASPALTDNHHTSQMRLTRPGVSPPSHGNVQPSSSSLHQTLNPCQPQAGIRAKQNALSVHQTLVSTERFGARTGDDLPGRVLPDKVQASTQVQHNSSETHSMKNMNSTTAHHVPDMTSSGTALTPDNQKSACEAAVSNTLLQHGDTVVGNRKVISLIQCGVIKPGDNVLQLTLKGCTYRASLLPDGSIKDTKDQLFLSPEEWIVSLLEPNIPVTKAFAWKKVTYRSKSLLMYLVSSDLAASQAFIPDVTPTVTHHKEKAVKTSISNFMKINKILLISDDEFMPSCLLDHYWDVFSQSEHWAI